MCRGSYRGVPGTIQGVQGKLSRRTWHYPRVESYHTIQGWKAITRLSGFEGGVWVWRPGLPLFLESLWAAGIGWLETPSQKPSILYRNRTRNGPFLVNFRASLFYAPGLVSQLSGVVSHLFGLASQLSGLVSYLSGLDLDLPWPWLERCVSIVKNTTSAHAEGDCHFR